MAAAMAAGMLAWLHQYKLLMLGCVALYYTHPAYAILILVRVLLCDVY